MQGIRKNLRYNYYGGKKMKTLANWIVLSLIFSLIGTAEAAIINFDDLTPNPAGIPANYAGLTWVTSTDDSVPGETGFFSANADTNYSTPHSSPNYVVNSFGPNNLSFSFPLPVDFNGAWFAEAFGAIEDYRATQVRFRDDQGNTSAWLDILSTPQFLQANFNGATTIYVERQGGAGTSYPILGNGRWYTMDDVTYNASVPEPSTLLLLGFGLAGVGILRKRFKN